MALLSFLFYRLFIFYLTKKTRCSSEKLLYNLPHLWQLCGDVKICVAAASSSSSSSRLQPPPPPPRQIIVYSPAATVQQLAADTEHKATSVAFCIHCKLHPPPPPLLLHRTLFAYIICSPLSVYYVNHSSARCEAEIHLCSYSSSKIQSLYHHVHSEEVRLPCTMKFFLCCPQ